MDLRVFCDQLPGHNRNISCTCHMPLRVQAITIDKRRICHPQPICPFVHPPDKFLFTAAYVFCHCHAGIICACHGNTLQHRVHRLRLPGFQKYLRSSHGCRIFRGRHFVLKLDAPSLQGIEDQQHGHNLCHTCRRPRRVCILLVNHRPCGSFHQDRRRRADLDRSLILCRSLRLFLRLRSFRLFFSPQTSCGIYRLDSSRAIPRMNA